MATLTIPALSFYPGGPSASAAGRVKVAAATQDILVPEQLLHIFSFLVVLQEPTQT